MSIMASFLGFRCPECGEMIMASEVKGTHESGLAVAICDWCGAELQVTEDKTTGKVRAERVKKN